MRDQLKITGMTCAACSARIEKTTGKLPGVQMASVNLTTEMMTFDYDGKAETLAAIKENVRKLGYDYIEKKDRSADKDKIAKLRDSVNALLAADSVEQQRDIFEQYQMADALWKPFIKWAMKRDMTLAMLGVPRAQRRQIDHGYPGGILQFVVDRVETVFTKLPLKDNYFWRVYLSGHYTPDCCPEYLKPESHQALRNGVADRVTTHTASVLQFVKTAEQPITRFILLDHMDWLTRDPTKKILTEEWQAIVDRAAPNARILWRSAGLSGEFINPIKVNHKGDKRPLGELLHYHRDLAGELHVKDRVHTYGSFCIADLKT